MVAMISISRSKSCMQHHTIAYNELIFYSKYLQQMLSSYNTFYSYCEASTCAKMGIMVGDTEGEGPGSSSVPGISNPRIRLTAT
jgi:hypothetical protein